MSLDLLLSQSPLDKYRKLEKRVAEMDRDTRGYRTLTAPALSEVAEALRNKLSERRKGNLKSIIEGRGYSRDLMTLSAVESLLEYKEGRDRNEPLTTGQTFYMSEKVDGKVQGFRAHYLGENKISTWVRFEQDERIMKIFEMMNYGDDDDFRKIYFELADGHTMASTSSYLKEHITESSDKALTEMANYCDKRWDGPWAWEARIPIKLFDIIKEHKMTRLEDFRVMFAEEQKMVVEGEVERSEAILQFNSFNEELSKMIERLGRISGEMLTTGRDRITTEFGEDIFSTIEQSISERLRSAVDGLSSLRAATEETLDNLSNDTGVDTGVDFDAPMDEPMDDELSSDIEGDVGDPDLDFDDDTEIDIDADIELDMDADIEGERDKK